jgi:hypothetical protein
LRCYSLQLYDAEIAALIDRGLLASEEENDRAAMTKAMHQFLDGTLGRSK